MTRVVLAALTAALVFPLPAAAFTPSDPLYPKQYYLPQDHAFDAFGDALPGLDPVRIAIIDSGIDGTHPEFQPRSRIWAAKSFVGGSPYTDENGHGTFVAGEIAAAVNNGQGIAGIAFPAQLIIAKIARADASISIDDEAAAIRWSVDHGAQVINMSFGGVRDPLDPKVDLFSPEEAAAVAYAVRHGVVIVAAVGNCDNDAPTCPWPYADYPAALPHVIGVSALTETGNVASFSDRDQIYNDISAPGDHILSTVPLAMTALSASCPDQGYSDCGTADFRRGRGTSFAAPQVTAAAALLLALPHKPPLKPDQVSYLLEHSADDVTAANGCRLCAPGRDALSGWGRLNIQSAIAALESPLPPADRAEPNDDAGAAAATFTGTKLTATLDFWDDQLDVYRIHLTARQRVQVRVKGPRSSDTDLLLWKPGTVHVNDLRTQRMRAGQALGPGASKHINYRARRSGWYYVEVKLETRGFGPYTLSITRK